MSSSCKFQLVFQPETQLNKSGVEDETGEEISSQCHLKPPQLQKLLLISPPASPPVGWEPREEAEPINYELIAGESTALRQSQYLIYH